VLTRFAMSSSGTMEAVPGAGQIASFGPDVVARMRQELDPLSAIQNKVFENTVLLSQQPDESFLRITTRDLRHAAIALALWQCSRELTGRKTEQDREGLRQDLIKLRHSETKPNDARRLLDELDWFWPTHLSLAYRDADDRVSARQHRELLSLIALADDVIQQPLGRAQAVIPLGPMDGVSISERLKKAFPFGIGSKQVEDIAARMDKAPTGAEAMLRLFSADDDVDSTPMDFFTRLRDWERTGLLEHITLTVKRLHQVDTHDGEPDEVIVTWDQLSDGEQMLLGRIGLLYLLRGQDGSLLLLDEPETHFNDVWKREIVDMVDAALLNTTEAGVIVCTHTSIALTDAFAAEVTVLDKQDGRTHARSVTGGLFGTDPGEVNMTLFRADSSIGRRSLAILDRLLETDWKGRETELEEILKVLGSSFHRAELRALLKQLKAPGDGAA
jgi:AAA domain, putative AbiEii toxin, Type IV TA system